MKTYREEITNKNYRTKENVNKIGNNMCMYDDHGVGWCDKHCKISKWKNGYNVY